MTSATVRRAVIAVGLTAALTLLPALSAPAAVADVGDNDIVRLKLTGVTETDTMPEYVEAGDSWVTYLNLYDSKKRFAGDASSRCSAVEATRDHLTAQCTRVLRLKKGEITLHDMITRTNDAPITAKTAIAGGAGIYNDAEGEGYITLTGNRVHFDLHVDD
ncbi:hypothetical protein [Streptomyces flaveus]|uniref:Secreted protein n=1 Tax=Streptomyces flaveus TaxID=66370 RepID=A0A917RNF5_9ACTN|nr:hypothetical protein [Streptomyces flaveus]GGL16097.1 hypothetical protein GCM10010094_91230 [Streptomyces flaveus]